MEHYNFSDFLISRAPSCSFKEYAINRTAKIILDPYFKQALFLANAPLYHLLAEKKFKWIQLTAREKQTIRRYYNRYCFRPTPFGSFSSFTLTKWGDDQSLTLQRIADAQLHVSLDQEILLSIGKLVKASIIDDRYICNPTIYKWAKEYRFIKTSLSPNHRKLLFDLESIDNNTLTKGVFAFCKESPRQKNEIIDFIVDLTGCELEIAKNYVGFLIGTNLLMSSYDPNILGKDYGERLIAAQYPNKSRITTSLFQIQEIVRNMKFPSLNDLINLEKRLKVLELPGGIESAKQYFYTGLERQPLSGSVHTGVQSHIRDGLKALEVLSQSQEPPMLRQFINQFKKKYDKKEIPLLQAVDPDIGLGYGHSINALLNLELLQNINFGRKKSSDQTSIEWSAAHRSLLKKWNATIIMLDDNDLNEIKPVENLKKPPSISVLFRITKSGVYLESVGGASATSLIGRFTAWSKEIQDFSRSIAELEQSANPDVIFADIGQLSDGHADNINRRKSVYDYEIPVNVISTLPTNQQIQLSDLWLSVINDQLILTSKSLNTTVIPRLTSAYNYTRNQLGIFRLLGDLQYQGIQGSYSFSLENYFPGMTFYPRVMYKQAILSAALWHLDTESLKRLYALPPEQSIAEFKVLKKALNLPAIVALSKFDQQLIFNFNRDAEITFFLDTIKGSRNVALQEFFMPGETVNEHEESSPLVNQFVASMYLTTTTYSDIQSPIIINSRNSKSDFILGSKWLYLKIYCNPAMANKIMANKILPVIKHLNARTKQPWFFIRYNDPDHHIRLRIKLNERDIGQVIKKLKVSLQDSITYNIIRDYQADTYHREMERYGPDIIEQVEDLFHASSELVLNYIKKSALKTFKYNYHSLAFMSVLQLTQSFLIDINEEIAFLQSMVELFYVEFASDKSLKIDLDQKYRELKQELHVLSANKQFYEGLELTAAANQFANQINGLVITSLKFDNKRKKQLLADLIHMHLNRLFVDKQRNQELIVYFVLFKFKIAVRAIAKSASKPSAGF